MDQSAKFWDKIAEKYSKQPIADEAAYQKKLQITRGYFNPDMEVLEFGCGTGSTAIIHAPYVKHILATDISSNMIEIARAKATAKGIKNITFEASAIDSLSIPDESLDIVLGSSILHLLENKEETIVRIYNMLKPGGVFVSSTVCLTGIMKLMKPVIPIGRLFGYMPQTVKFFSQKELEKSLTDAGFDIDYQWQPEGRVKTVFIVTKKPE